MAAVTTQSRKNYDSMGEGEAINNYFHKKDKIKLKKCVSGMFSVFSCHWTVIL